MAGNTKLAQWWREHFGGVAAPQVGLSVEPLRVPTNSLAGPELASLYTAAVHACPVESLDMFYQNLQRAIGFGDPFGVALLDSALGNLTNAVPQVKLAAIRVDEARRALTEVRDSLPELFRLNPAEAARLAAGQGPQSAPFRPRAPNIGTRFRPPGSIRP